MPFYSHLHILTTLSYPNRMVHSLKVHTFCYQKPEAWSRVQGTCTFHCSSGWRSPQGMRLTGQTYRGREWRHRMGEARDSVIIGKVQGFGDEKHMFSVWWDEKLSWNYVWAILSKMVIIHMKNMRPHPGSHNWKNWKPKTRSLHSYSRKTDSKENYQVNKKKIIFLGENQN